MYSGFDGEQRISFPNSWSDWMQIVWMKSLSSGRLCFFEEDMAGRVRRKKEAGGKMVYGIASLPFSQCAGHQEFLGKRGGFFLIF